MLKTRISRAGVTVAAIAAVAFPAVALAAGGQQADRGDPPARIEAQMVPLERPAEHLHKTIAVQVSQIRSERRSQLRRQRERRLEAFTALPGGVSQATLDSIAACESGGDPTAVDSSGTYRGKYQFDTGTWASVGGSGDPAAAPESEQDYRAALLYSQSGSSPWPICG
jgi:Transglycosylase-like domain